MLSTHEAAHAIRADAFGPDARFTNVSTDTRELGPGSLFVALRGERFDGHNFLAQAFAAGAVAAMVDRGAVQERDGRSFIIVDDTRRGLGALAADWRRRCGVTVAAVTGSNGKTTVKEMIAAILRAHCQTANEKSESVLATLGNLNNDIGVPLMLLKLTPQHRYAVIEMGMNHSGEIAYLSKMASPHVALVNNVQRAHLGMFDNIEELAEAKAEIFSGLDEDGVAVINADDAHAGLMRVRAADVECLDFGIEKPAAMSARYRLQESGSHIDITTPSGALHVDLPLPGLHNVSNALAAASVALALGIDSRAIVAGLRGMAPVKGRLVRKSGRNGAVIIDDTYNANPDSVHAAIAVLAALPGNRVLVLGDMGEIGPLGPQLHAEVGAAARRAHIDHLYALGELSEQASHAFGAGANHFADLDALLAALANELRAGTTILVKGSRFMAMERVVERLVEAKA